MNEQIYLTDIKVIDVEKRYEPSKYYVYNIWTIWSDKTTHFIFRRYSQFFQLQVILSFIKNFTKKLFFFLKQTKNCFKCQLLDTFKEESGEIDPTKRIIPFLPGKILFGRSQIKSVAIDRLHSLNKYCHQLISLKDEISRSSLVLNFFQSNGDDLKKVCESGGQKTVLLNSTISSPVMGEQYICIRDFKAKEKTTEISILKDTKVFVIEKCLNGWWFVKTQDNQGFVPQIILEPMNSNIVKESIEVNSRESFAVLQDYKSKKVDELTLNKGSTVNIIEKNLNGWWKVK
jgi:SH3 and PX domain-containing protein 2